MRRQHSEHNEQLCDLLIANGSFNDWVITSAFYSALHIIQHQLFPLTIGTVVHGTFEDYYSRVIKQTRTKHKSMISLCSGNLSSCYASYKWLHDACHGARYNDYRVDPSMANKARQELTRVKAVCTKP